MLVIKFGGTSVKDAEMIQKAVEIITAKTEKAVIVVSAMAGITDLLVKLLSDIKSKKDDSQAGIINQIYKRHYEAAEALGLNDSVIDRINEYILQLRQLVYALDILGEVSPKSTDLALSFGEKLSSLIVFNALKKAISQTTYANYNEAIITDDEYTEANVLIDETKGIINSNFGKLFENNNFIVCAGFIGSTVNGFTTTLGRGGSDYSAALIASALNADSLEIWTDVDGILTSDPKIIRDAKLVKELSYNEASELAYFGAKVLHPKTILPAIDNNIPVFVRNTYNPAHTGTKIISVSKNIKDIKAIAFRRDITVINIHSSRMLGAYGFLSRIFDIFRKYETSVDLVTTSEVNISLTVETDDMLDSIISDLQVFSNVEVFKNKAIISAVGEGIRDTAGIGARFFGALKGVNVSMVSVGASEVNFTVLIDDVNIENAVLQLHEEFFTGNINNDIFEKIVN